MLTNAQDDDDLDPVKRMRFTPQPQVVSSSSMTNNEHDMTRISDSMPGTSVENSTVRRQLAQMEEALETERAGRRMDQRRHCEREAIWDQRQTAFENLTQEHRRCLGEIKAMKEQAGTMTKNLEALRERNMAITAENQQLTSQLKEQRGIDCLSRDDQVVVITQLRTEVATAQEEMQRATKRAQTAESTLEYTKEQYRAAQDAATSERAKNDQLTVENAKLAQTASGEPARLKAIHYSKQYENVMQQNRALRSEKENLKRALAQSQEETTRWKNNAGRIGVGTRAQSVTPQPKVRSRAASPMGGRLSNLRNG